MRNTLLLITIFSLLWLMSCKPSDTTNSNSVARSSPTVSPTVSPAPSLPPDANLFALDVAQNGLARVDLGQLAARKGSSSEVKQFAQRLIADHTEANNELKQIAVSKSITLPTEVKPQQKVTYARLLQLSGAEFDREFISVMLENHDESVKNFQEMADRGTDAEIKAFAAKVLPTLQEHLRAAREMNSRVTE